jgi:hypothetical protein
LLEVNKAFEAQVSLENYWRSNLVKIGTPETHCHLAQPYLLNVKGSEGKGRSFANLVEFHNTRSIKN